MLHHLQLVTLWITVLNSHHLLKKRSINGSNSTFHNSPNCESKWILCTHTSMRAYIHIHIHTLILHAYISDFFILFFSYTVGVVVCVVVWIVAASASPVFDFDECESSLLNHISGNSCGKWTKFV
jgi:hypothetical protein